MRRLTCFIGVCVGIGLLGGCGGSSSSAGSGGTVGGPGGQAGLGGATGTGATTAAGGTTGAGGMTAGQLGPTIRVRVVQLVPGVTFDAWGADTKYQPVRVGQNIAYETISDYLNVPYDSLSTSSSFVLLPSGVVPTGSSWQVVPVAGDRTRVQLTGLNATNNQSTVILTSTDSGTNISVEALAEGKLGTPSATKATLHISYNIFDLGGSVVPALAVVGQPCFLTSSSGVADAFSVDPGAFTVGLYDLEDASECTTTPLATVSLSVAAGTAELIAMYHQASLVKFLHAPIVVTP